MVLDYRLSSARYENDFFDSGGEKFGFLKANIAYGLEREDLSERLRKYLKSLI